MEKDSIKFVVRHYQPGAFQEASAWKHVSEAIGSSRGNAYGQKPIGKRMRTLLTSHNKIAAVLLVCIVLTASATLLLTRHQAPAEDVPRDSDQIEATSRTPAPINVLDLDKVPLTEVVEKIEELYTVKIDSLLETPEQYLLTLHFEGTAQELVNAINELYGLNLQIEQL